MRGSKPAGFGSTAKFERLGAADARGELASLRHIHTVAHAI
jgi:hypothetical protein